MGLPAHISNLFGFLTEPGDKLEAYITDTGKKVLKGQKNKGKHKIAIVKYDNGTVVKTESYKE